MFKKEWTTRKASIRRKSLILAKVKNVDKYYKKFTAFKENEKLEMYKLAFRKVLRRNNLNALLELIERVDNLNLEYLDNDFLYKSLSKYENRIDKKLIIVIELWKNSITYTNN